MPIQYKINVLESLKKAGYSTYKLTKESILSGSTITKLKNKQSISWDNLERICKLLHCQPGDIIEYVEDPE